MISNFFEYADASLDVGIIQNEMKKFGKGNDLALQLPKFDLVMRGFINSSVDCERLFSVMNLIMDKRRVSKTEMRRRNLMSIMFNRSMFGKISLPHSLIILYKIKKVGQKGSYCLKNKLYKHDNNLAYFKTYL